MRRLFAIEGLACPSCAAGVERRLAHVPGISLAKVHYLTSSVLLDWDEVQLDAQAIVQTVQNAGYRLIERHHPVELAEQLDRQVQSLSVRLAIALFFGMWVMGLALLQYMVTLPAQTAWKIAVVSAMLSLPVLLFSALPMFRMGWRSLQLGDPSTDLLFATATILSIVLSAIALCQNKSAVWFDAATMLVTALLLARLLDAITRRSAIRALIAMEEAAPEEATICDAGRMRRVLVKTIVEGMTVQVDAGEAVAVDGIILAGKSLVNRSILTGESSPVDVVPGDRVEAGCVNLTERIVIKVDRLYGDREVDRLGGSIASEIAAGGAEQGRAESWSAALLYVIPVASVASGLVVFLDEQDLTAAALTALTLWAGLCPCALALAIPLVRLRLSAIGAANGFRIREPRAFEALATVRNIVLDKTGTVTSPELRVVAVEPAEGIEPQEVLIAAAKAETGIRHPIAMAIVALTGEVGSGGRRSARSAEYEALDGEVIRVAGAGERADGRTAVCVDRGGVSIGTIVMENDLLPQASWTVQQLHKMHLTVHLASGDACGPTVRVGAALSLQAERVRAQLTPQDKARLVQQLDAQTVVVGDGVNDALAFAAGVCGISVAGAHGAARQIADVAIERGGVERIPALIQLSRMAARIASQNLYLSVGYNALLIPAAISGAIGPGIAAFAMAASSASVCVNALRLRWPSKRDRRDVEHPTSDCCNAGLNSARVPSC
ncbi:heavy metal translocating P-type ATPase [Rhizobium paknamense]|uniref:P-type E1-E2 ATPase n=1 Tax=Rhizobium paknamense TaxID=1206817 RepID=A0ABU0IJP9_9HYPH|nr:HAD-IC family P-type ATPase [Rhizobium paknamense]MDQ0457461.1 P-type E1-E2 ATPase [Rhizobium paknamense]